MSDFLKLKNVFDDLGIEYEEVSDSDGVRLWITCTDVEICFDTEEVFAGVFYEVDDDNK